MTHGDLRVTLKGLGTSCELREITVLVDILQASWEQCIVKDLKYEQAFRALRCASNCQKTWGVDSFCICLERHCVNLASALPFFALVPFSAGCYLGCCFLSLLGPSCPWKTNKCDYVLSAHTLPVLGANAVSNGMGFPPIFAPADHLAKKNGTFQDKRCKGEGGHSCSPAGTVIAEMWLFPCLLLL